MCPGFCLLRLLWRSNWSMCASIHQQFDDAADDVTTPVRQYGVFGSSTAGISTASTRGSLYHTHSIPLFSIKSTQPTGFSAFAAKTHVSTCSSSLPTRPIQSSHVALAPSQPMQHHQNTTLYAHSSYCPI